MKAKEMEPRGGGVGEGTRMRIVWRMRGEHVHTPNIPCLAQTFGRLATLTVAGWVGTEPAALAPSG